MTKFIEFDFGRASAEIEGTEVPQFLLDGFYDNHGVIDSLLNAPPYLVLGYKGTGKSAIGQHLYLRSQSRGDFFASHFFLGDFPYRRFEKIIRGDIESESRLPNAWSWVLVYLILLSIERDTSFSNPKISELIDIFKSSNLWQAGNFMRFVTASSRPSFMLTFPEYSDLQDEFIDKGAFELIEFIEYAKATISECGVSNNHVVVIDGLDDILTKSQLRYNALGALVFEANRMNLLFLQQKSPIKIIVVCRTDLYERLPVPNKNKLRQDLAIHLNWFDNPGDVSNVPLLNLINSRARLHHEEVNDIFKKFFPERSRNNETEIRKYLLDYTRHTPRDLIQLLSHIQNFAPNREGKMTHDQLESGLRGYSIEYFGPEIKDELAGYFTPDEIEGVFSTLTKMNSRDFKKHLFLDEVKQSGYVFDSKEALKALFECSAIGNRWHQNGKTFYSFKYRNRNSAIDENQEFIIHRGLWKSLNIG